MRHIDTLQNVNDWYDENNGCYIWEYQCNVGFYAPLEYIVAYFDQRIMELSDQEIVEKYNCPQNSMDYFFLPVSTCTADDVLNQI